MNKHQTLIQGQWLDNLVVNFNQRKVECIVLERRPKSLKLSLDTGKVVVLKTKHYYKIVSEVVINE